MKEKTVKLSMFTAACLLAGAAVAATGSSNEFRLDCRTGVRTAAATEKIQYSTAWATNLTATQQGEAKAVVKVNPCLKTPPKYLVVDMSGGRSAARWPVSYLDEVPSGGWTDEYKTEKLVLRYIPAGSFIMGGRATDYPGAVNTNLHMVTLTKPFYIGVFECTQRQWELAMGTRPSFFTNETCYATRPVDRVSYSEIRGQNLGLRWPTVNAVDEDSFLDIIRRKSGLLGLDLPTDAQWEYACRAGSATSLNTGVNLSNEIGDYACAEIMDAARFGGNSDYPRMVAEGIDCKGVTDAKCSAKVGSYRPNAWGLYDMHGNLWELCLDRATEVPLGSKDPVGSSDETIVRRMIRGGGYNELAWRCTSGFRYSDINGMGYLATAHGQTVGFRICLHDATVYPSADSATVLVNASGAAAADWTPTRAGTYQLTHEVQVDGVTVAPMESALFKVEGPELEIVPMGELTNGVAVKVEKVGGGGEWTVYYSLDGSEPTAGSTKYEGPFALPASATVKAVAISPSGVSSEVASKELVLSPALAVEDAKARQRYPWNGKVDIDCEITGDATKKYRVSFSVSDEIGKTNLTIKTVSIHSTPTPTTYTSSPSSEFVLPPGKYRFVWDAAADLPKGTRFGEVSVSIDAVPSPLADWKRVVTISTDGYAGSETLTDVPVLVRLSSAIEGFDYADFAAPDTGADMIFTDMDGVARYPYEIDEWHQGGESLVWVKLPELKKGTKFKLAYGSEGAAREDTSSTVTTVPPPSSATGAGKSSRDAMKHAVWADYAGVWHMNEDSGTAFDSTEHGLDALPSCGTNKLADVSQMVAYENGACGRARVVSSIEPQSGNNWMTCGTYYHIPSYDALTLNDKTVVSCWLNGHVAYNFPRLISRKHANDDAGGFEISLNTSGEFDVRGGSGDVTAYVALPDYTHNWACLTVMFAGRTVICFTNGVKAATFENAINAIGDNGLPLGLGNKPDVAINPAFVGQYDEIRLRGGTLSADRIKADYDMIAKRDFCTYGKVEAGPGADPVPPSVHSAVVTFNPNGGTLVGQSLVIYKGDSVVFGTMPTATKDGYSFRGWGRTADATEVVKSTDIVPDSGCELFAVWDELTYTVKFNANGGTGTMADEEFTYGIAQSLTANVFKKDGCTFAGWATSATGGKVYDDKQSVNNLTTTPGGTVTLFAVWKEALYMVIDLSGGSSAKSYPVSYLSEVPNNGTWPDAYKTTKLVLRKVKKGSNTAGGSMSKDMWVGVFELTQRQTTQIYGTFLKKGNYNGYAYAYLTIGEKYPMIHSLESNVELGETINTRLNSRVSSLNFVIPTKDQWIYACRAGTTTPFNNGTSDEAGLKKVAVCLKKSSYYTAYEDVGSRDPNAWGLYDMHGNVSERVGSVTGPYYSYAGTSYLITCMGGFFNGGVDTCKADGERSELAYQSFSHDSASGAADRNSWGYRVFAVTK